MVRQVCLVGLMLTMAAIATIAAQGSVPGAPRQLQAIVTGTVTLTWLPPSDASAITGYVVEAGATPGTANLAVLAVGANTTFTAAAPPGVYYVRVRAISGAGQGPPSNEIQVVVGGACSGLPLPPRSLTTSVSGNTVQLAWLPPAAGVVSAYEVRAGTRARDRSLLTANVGTQTIVSATAAAGSYYVSVVALGPCGTSAESNEVVVPVGVPFVPSGQEISCADWFSLNTPVGRLVNNVWNKAAAGSFASRQCLRTDGTRYGWSWSWPPAGTTVFAYPETIFGWKPWDGGVSTHARLPIRVNVIRSFIWNYAVETRSTGRFNLASSMWLTRSGVTTSSPNPSDISTEFMIWTDGYTFTPAGQMIGIAIVDGIQFEVWYARDWGDVSGANSNHWDYVAYRATSPRLSVSLDIKKILEDAVARGVINPTHYVSNIEVGNEILSGAGETWITALSLDVQ